MNIVEREWTHHPFRYRRITLANLVRDFEWRRKSSWSLLYKNRDDIVDFCAASSTLPHAIRRACRSKRPNGKHHNHQSKVKSEVLMHLESRLTHVHRHLRSCRSFSDLYALVESHKPVGIGPVTTYDVTTRIGAYLDLHPQEVYLHAGALAGYVELQKALNQPRTRDRIIPKAKLPVPLRQLPADSVEDFLCVYRTVFQEINR